MSKKSYDFPNFSKKSIFSLEYITIDDSYLDSQR